MNRYYRILILALGTALVCASPGSCQQPTSSSPQSQSGTSAGSNQQSQTTAPEQTAVGPVSAGSVDLSGPETFTPGNSGPHVNYLLPSLQFSEMADSNASFGTARQQFESVERVGGRLALQHVERRGVTTLDYVGAGVIYTNRSDLNTTMHQFGITQTYVGPRWNLTFDDRASYLPESAYGTGDFGWGGALGTSLGGAMGTNLVSLNPSFNPNQSLYSSRGDRISNVTSVSVGYVLSARSSMNVSGSYGLLHFMNAGGIDSSSPSFSFGYNRLLSARDSFGVSYGVSFFRFRHIGESFNTHSVQFEYGHRLTGRLSMEVGGGPEFSVFRITTVGSSTLTSWTAHTSVNYQRARNAFGLSFSRYASNGGGVFIGAQTNNLEFNWTRSLGRKWTGSVGPGYAYNQSFRQTTAGANQFSYNSYYIGTSLSRSLGRYMSMFITYNFEGQSLQSGSCTGGGCNASLIRHVFSFGFDWHPRQLVVD